jgi:hypothetical protein
MSQPKSFWFYRTSSVTSEQQNEWYREEYRQSTSRLAYHADEEPEQTTTPALHVNAQNSFQQYAAVSSSMSHYRRENIITLRTHENT